MKKNMTPYLLFVLIFLLQTISILSYAQNQKLTVTGQVLELGSNTPVTTKISVKENSLVFYTDTLGKFSIEISSSSKHLLFEADGFMSKEINIENNLNLTVYLEPFIDIPEEFAEDVIILYDEMDVEHFNIVLSAPSLSGRVPGLEIEQPINNESYAHLKENSFNKVSSQPLSTFSVDVDRASYSNVRRNLNSGYLPNKDAVRIEEMINYFDYDYPQPNGETPFSINHELSTCPWNKDNLLLKIGLQGKKMEREELPKSNIVFLIDVSGSMSSHNKLPLLKSSLKMLLNNLSDDDKVAIVVYAGSSELRLNSTKCSDKNKIIEALESLNAGGSTAGGEGLKLAYQTAKENFIRNGNNRIILATDGDFNVGQSSNQEMEDLITENRDKGIAISVLGFGMGNYKDDKMEIIADKGNGNYAYIDNLQEAQKVLVKEFGGTFVTIAKDVKFQLEFNPKYVQEYRLIGYENRLLAEEDFDNDEKDAGEIGAGHSVTALYEIIPTSENNSNSSNNLKYQKSELTDHAQLSDDLITLKLRYKEPEKSESKLIEVVVSNKKTPSKDVSKDFKFTASIAEFGMMLKDSKFKKNTTWESVIQLAKEGKGEDEDGYRSEMIRLVELAKSLSIEYDN